MEKVEEMTASQIKEAMAQSGKINISQWMAYMEARYKGKYNKKLAREVARELKTQM